MKKALLSLAIISGVFLVGCQSNPNDSQDVVPAVDEVVETKSTVEDPSKELSDAEKELLSILDNIQNKVEVGTAGSSLKAVRYTSDLMNWAVGTELVDNQIAKVLNIKLDSLSEDEKLDFKDQLSLLDGTYKALLSNSRDELLESSGNAGKDNYWIDSIDSSTTFLENMEALMKAAGLR